ncbi:hypothetical protein AA309_22335 [Microvirga vignae]|uniref:Peptidoglycan binding-like domain-containing protein n=1 Tax=Microvirga vignae TaxID=1225564 RepID=A0A0H1R7C3_9HYPH|nr:peptidoglycan-binding protein [Microvirga vignae]KLK91053.1 hypothetical protein AA309_22335 [Microvirga vignae]
MAQFAATSSLAQNNAAGFIGLIGGMIAAAQAQAAKEAWANQPEMRVYCFNRALVKYRTNVASIIQGGVMPNDPRLAPVVNECARFEPSALKTKYRCTIDDENGSAVQSTCYQVFARQDSDGQLTQTDVRTAIDLYFNNGSYLLADLETDAGRQERYAQAQRQRMLAELAALRTEIEGLLTSRSDAVRAQGQKLVKRIQAANNPKASVSSSDVDTIRRGYNALVRFEETESVRIASLDSLNEVKANVEQKATGELPPEIRSDFEALQAKYAVASQPPQPVAAVEKEDDSIGPTFDCSKVKDPLGRIICSDNTLRRLDVDLLRPYYILRFSVTERRDEFKQEAVAFTQSVLQICGVPEKGNLSAAAMKKAAPCIATEYRRQRDLWQAQMVQLAPASARDETGRSLDEHVRLQKMLQDVGLIPSTEKADGVYGVGTRTAISSFQSSESLTADGILSDETAERLMRRASQAVAGGDGPSGEQGAAGQLEELKDAYADLIERIDRYESRRARERQLIEMVAQAESFARDMATQPLPEPVKAALASLSSDIEQARANPSVESHERIVMAYDAVKTDTENAIRVAKATTDRNRFIIEGDAADLLVLYNDSGKAPTLVRNLKGDLVFQGDKSGICQLHDGAVEKRFAVLANARFEKYQQRLSFPLSRCDTSRLVAYDLIVLNRKQLLASDQTSDVVALLKAVDEGSFKTLFTVTGGDVEAVIQAEANRLKAIEDGIQNGSAKGFGFVALNNGQGSVCQTSGGNEPAHAAVLQSATERLAEELKAAPAFRAMSVEDAFIAAKRGECIAVYSEAGELKSLTAALQRDGVPFRYLPVWVDQEQLAKAVEALRLAAEKAAAEEKAKAEAEAKRIAQEKAWAEAKSVSSHADRSNSQRSIERMLKDYTDRYNKASSSQASLMRADRKRTLSQMFGASSVSRLRNWIGRIERATLNQNGDIDGFKVSIEGATFESVAPIKAGTDTHKALIEGSARPVDFLLFSADVSSVSETDFFPEKSMTDYGSMTSPEYKVAFTSVKVITKFMYDYIRAADASNAEQEVSKIAQVPGPVVSMTPMRLSALPKPIDTLEGEALIVGRKIDEEVKKTGKAIVGGVADAVLGEGASILSDVLIDMTEKGMEKANGGGSWVGGELVLYNDHIDFVESGFSQMVYTPSERPLSMVCSDLRSVRAIADPSGERALEFVKADGSLRFRSDRADFFLPRIRAICDPRGEVLK